MTDITPELRIRALELAERSVYQPCMANYGTAQHNGGPYDNYRDKDLNEIIKRAERILTWCTTGEDATTPNSLIDKLRGVLCEGK